VQHRTHAIVHKYIDSRIKIRTTAQQKTVSVSERVSVRSLHHELSTSSLSVVLCKRFEKNDLFGNMSALYIVMEHTSGKRRRALYHLFSPRNSRTLLSLFILLGSHTLGIFIFITATSRAPESTDFLSPHRCESILTRSRLRRFRKLINPENLSYFLHSSRSRGVSVIYILIRFMRKINSTFVSQDSMCIFKLDEIVNNNNSN